MPSKSSKGALFPTPCPTEPSEGLDSIVSIHGQILQYLRPAAQCYLHGPAALNMGDCNAAKARKRVQTFDRRRTTTHF